MPAQRRATARTIRIVVISAGVLVVAAIAVGVGVHAASGLSVGKELEEINGQTHTTHYSAPSQAPSRDLPGWFPKSATSITVEVPGPNSKSPGGRQADADVPAGYELPATCAPTGQSFPWAGGFDGLNIPASTLSLCAGWTATVARDHLYVWRS